MTLSYLHNLVFLLNLFTALAQSALLNVTGETITTRFWDCCKPSCAWNAKAQFNKPVQTCDKNDAPLADVKAGTGCGEGGFAYSCNNQHPWAVNDTFSYGFAGIFITGHPETEEFWCCACYQLNFTSDPLKGKTMVVQASNTAFDINTTNRFSLAIPGGNTTSHDACAKQYGVEQSVFGQTNLGVGSVEDCDKLPDKLKDTCRWRFEWFNDALYPNATFKRIVCPSELIDKTGCKRDDEKALAEGISSTSTSLLPNSPLLAGLTIIIASLLLA